MTEPWVHIRALDPVAWANGAGTTRVAVAQGCPLGRHELGVRVSIAALPKASRFSVIPGIARIFALVGDVGGTLTVDGVAHDLRPLEPLAFDGGASVRFETRVPTAACNAMVCPCIRMRMERHGTGAPPVMDALWLLADARAMYVAAGAIRLRDGELGAGTLVRDTDALRRRADGVVGGTQLLVLAWSVRGAGDAHRSRE